MEERKEKKEEEEEEEEGEDTEKENLRELILQQLATLESSETSEDESYKVRLSCILEDDESESGGLAQKEVGRNKESEKGPPKSESEAREEEVCERVQITDLDDVTQCERTEDAGNGSDTTTTEEGERGEGFAIKKLKSSDNVHQRPFVVRRRELSSDSSDLDTSVTNSAEGHSSDVKIVEVTEEEDEEEKTLNLACDGYVESEEEEEEKETEETIKGSEGGKGVELERVDNESLAPIFAKVSRTYLEKTKSNVKWEENERIDFVFKELVEEVKKARAAGQLPGDHFSLQDVHIRGTSPRVYDPPVPPETYLWEELKRLRERGGYPWTYLDKPPFDEATWKKYMEHVYEPINPPPLITETAKARTPDVAETQPPQVSIIPEPEKQFKRIPSKGSLSKKESVEESKTSEEMGEEFQERAEERCLAPTPTTASETTASASKTDITSTVLDTSEFEDQPPKQGSLVKTRREQMRARATEIQQRLRNHAGRIRSKFSNIQKSGRRERPKREVGERRFRLPEMHAPKISLPDRSKFKIPEKAKLHLPERSKFHLPERPNFGAIAERMHLPERGKFHLPDKSKFHLPEKAKFHLPDKSKFHFPDKSKFRLPDKSKFHLPNRPKLELPRFRRASATEASPEGAKRKFELKSYPRLFAKHSKDYVTSSPKQTRGRTPPPRMQQQQQEKQQYQKTALTWTGGTEKLKYADDDIEGVKETDSRKSESLFEREGYMEDLEGVPTLSTKSSMSEISEERKKGVLEEINPDEFFLRQKGISQDDIDVGQYLSREIREAFRSPDVNALAKMDYDEENTEPRCRGEPMRPKRTGSVKKKSILKKSSASDPSISEDGYKTYPPRRPGRKSRSQSKSLLNEDAIIGETRPEYEGDVNLSRYDNVEDDEVSEYYKTPGPAKEYQHYKVPRSPALVVPSPPAEEELQGKRYEDWEDEEEGLREMMEMEPPKPTARRKQKKKMAEVESTGEEQLPQGEIKESEVVPEPQPLESPIPPKRTRTRSSGSRSLRSFPTVSDINQSFHSEPARENPELAEDEIVPGQATVTERSPLMASSPEFIPYEITDLDDPGFGYATVGKPTVSKPERKKKPERPPPPRRRKDVSVPVYNTYPRRAPIRPLRNYSTLGPSRPPRHKKPPPIERALSERQSKAYAELKSQFDDDVIEIGSCKDLQTEKVIEKMKGRPLPPPPRPPRQKSRGPEEESDQTEEEKLSLSILKDEEFPIERKVQAFVHAPPPGSEMVEEVCVSTQTDPLPEDFSFGTEESDMIPEFSHEQLKIQEAFLEEMKREEEEMRQRRGEGDSVDAELKAEVIRQIEDIIAEEKRMLEKKKEERMRRSESRPEKEEKSYLDVEPDMGYASLDRRGHRQEPAAAPQLPTKMEKLQVTELEVGTLNVHEVQSDQIFVKELQSNRVASQDIDNTGGTMSLGTVDIPPLLIDQIVAKIPWDAVRQGQESRSQEVTAPPVRPQRRRRGSLQESDEETPPHTRKTHRRHHRGAHSSDEEERRRRRRSGEGGRESRAGERGIPELSLELARACVSTSVQAMRSFVQTNASLAQSMDRELCVQAILCIAIALIAGFFLFGFDAKIVHLHKWDFQFPPQPPAGEF